MIQLVRITDPIDPSHGKDVVHVEHTGLTLPAYLPEEFKTGGVRAFLNGLEWPRELWPDVTPRDGDSLVLVPVVQGGALLRTLASLTVIVAAAVVSGGFGAGFASFLGGIGITASTAVAGSILAGAVTMAGGLLISAFMSGSQPNNKNASASYDPDGPRSLAQSGVVIPKGYGTFQWGGNIISSFTDYDGANQYINLLLSFGFGPARSMTSIQINGKGIESYQNCQYFTRLGSNDQTEIGQFNQINNGYPQDTQCLAGTPVVVPGTGTLTQALQVDIAFPDGVFVDTNDGNIIPAFVTYLVEYSVSGLNEWQPVVQPLSSTPVTRTNPDGSTYLPFAWGAVATDLPPASGVVYYLDNGPHTPGDPYSATETLTVYQPNGEHADISKTVQGEWQLLDVNLNYVAVNTWSAGYQDFAAAQTTPCYNRTQILGLAPGKYDVRITKWGSGRVHDDALFGDNWSPNIGQDMWVHSVNEISLLDLAYPNLILLGVRALATSQLSGSGINVTALIQHGLRSKDEGLLPAELAGFEEDNPACVAADMMLDDLYGGGAQPGGSTGIKLANLERFIDEWVTWAELNDTLVPDGNGNTIRLHVFNGIMDNESNLWDQLSTVTAMSRACIVPIGADYGVAVDQEVDAPVQMFTVGNTIQDSFTETWLPIDDRANQVEVQFADSTRYYREDNPLVYMDPTQQDDGVPVKNVRVRGKGITVPAQAWHFAAFKERCNQFLLRSGSFRTDTDGIACRQFNVIALQSDVPQWGIGGRLLPGSTTTRLLLDRNDAAFVSGTSYAAMVMHPSLQRFSGTVSAVATSTSPPGYLLTLGGWTNDDRVTRAIINGIDCAVGGSAVGTVVAVPPPGFTPATGNSVVLFDTDVLETVPVSGIDAVTGALVLSTPLSVAPVDYATYIYGASGAVKWVRITLIRRASENRSTIEWIDYDPDVYTVITPVIGETSAQATSNPGVTTLTGEETFQLVGGSYVTLASLSWKPGPDTAGAGIYAVPTGTSNLPQLIARVQGASTWQGQQAVDSEWVYTVVGYDANDVYAPFNTAPSVTIDTEGITTNLLLGSSFASGFTYWNLSTPTGTTLVPQFDNDGQALLTVGGATYTTAQQILAQVVPPSKWSIGQYLMLSGYVEDTAVAATTAPNVGDVILSIVFQDASGTTLSSQTVSAPLSGLQPTLTRFNTTAVAIPSGTAQVYVGVSLGGTGLSLPAGSTIAVSHFLLESSASPQTVPSEWADIDVNGQVLDLFSSGSSTGLRVQGSTVPTLAGSISCLPSVSSMVISWTSLVILWPDGAFTHIEDGSLTITGLTISTSYVLDLYFDVIYGGVHAAVPTTAIGSPAVLSAALDPVAEATCRQDGHVPLTPGGFTVTTSSAGTGSPITGGGSGTNPTFPIDCTVRGTELVTPQGPVSNEILKQRFDAGEDVFLLGREGPEKIVRAFWAQQPCSYRIRARGFQPFYGSASLTLKDRDRGHIWCSKLPPLVDIETVRGYREAIITRAPGSCEVLHIELEGPSHEYQAGGGVWTHNTQKINPGV